VGVAEVAAFLAARAARSGRRVDRRLVESAALLHDVDKILPDDAAGRDLEHGRASAAWLTSIGYAELGPIAAAHPVTRLVEEGFDPTALSLEAAIVAYADKRVGQRLETMRARFRTWERRYPGSWTAEDAELAWRGAASIERRVCASAGVRPDRVKRLRWVRAAMARATEADMLARVGGRSVTLRAG
jgi:hypothetical protein